MNNKIIIVGSGAMACDYARVLKAQHRVFSVIGRGAESALLFEHEIGTPVFRGGLQKAIEEGELLGISTAIVTVGIDQLAQTTIALLINGVKRILVEKPGGLDAIEIRQVAECAFARDAEVYIAYNRRFYSTTHKAREIIAADGGVVSFNFEFTEWSHVIADLTIPAIVKQHWFLANSSHVVDLAFFLGGLPREMSGFVSGSVPWHPAATAFAGAGVTYGGALFSYQANWSAPGRWGLEVLTRANRLIFRPLEQLHIQKLESVSVDRLQVDDALDINFKPGLYRQVDAFLSANPSKDLLTIADQLSNAEHIYARIICP